MTSARQRVRDLIDQRHLSAVTQLTYKLRYECFHPLARVFLSATPEYVDEGGRIDWEMVEPVQVDQPVTLGEIGDWLERGPGAYAIRAFSSLFTIWRSESPTWAEAIDVCAQRAPRSIQSMLPASGFLAHEAVQEMLGTLGEPVGRALALCANEQQGSLNLDVLRFLDPEGVLAFFQTCDRIRPHTLTQTIHKFPDALELPDEVGEAYTELMLSIRNHSEVTGATSSYRIDQRWLNGEQIARIISNTTDDLVLCHWLMATCAFDGCAQAFDAFAALLDDETIGEEAALYLGLGGQWGWDAARKVVASKQATPLARERAATLLSYSPPKHPLSDRILSPLLGHLVKYHRFGLDFDDLLIKLSDEARRSPPERVTPTSYEALEALLEEPDAVHTPQAWFDLLCLKAFQPKLGLSMESYESAIRRDILGQVPNRASFVRLIERLDWQDELFTPRSSKRYGFGLALLGAGASEEIYCHAIAHYKKVQTSHVLGHFERCFSEPLEASDVAWKGAVAKLVWYFRFDRANPYRALEHPICYATAEGKGSVTLDAPGDVFFECFVGEHVPCVITVRGDVTLHVDPKGGTFRFHGLSNEERGQLPPLEDGGYIVNGEIHRGRGMFGVNGVVVAGHRGLSLGAIEANQTSPIKITTRSKDVTCRIELSEKFSETLGNHVLAALRDLNDVQNLVEIRALQNPTAAYTLFLFSQLAPSERARQVALEQLRELGDLAAPYLAKTSTSSDPKPLDVVSFDEIATRMGSLGGEALCSGEEVPSIGKKWIGFQDINAYPSTDHGDSASYEDEEPHMVEIAVPIVASAVILVDPARAPKENASHDRFGENLVHRMLSTLGGLAANHGWYNSRAAGAVHVDKQRGLILMDLMLESEEPDDGCGVMEGNAHLASWRCEEGWLFASWGRSREELARVIGLDVWPPQTEWQSLSGVLRD